MSLEQIRFLVAELVCGLAHIHAKDIVYCAITQQSAKTKLTGSQTVAGHARKIRAPAGLLLVAPVLSATKYCQLGLPRRARAPTKSVIAVSTQGMSSGHAMRISAPK